MQQIIKEGNTEIKDDTIRKSYTVNLDNSDDMTLKAIFKRRKKVKKLKDKDQIIQLGCLLNILTSEYKFVLLRNQILSQLLENRERNENGGK